MHFICSAFGSAGDVFPLLGLALELKTRGHGITFATSPHFQSLVEKYALPFHPYGTEEDYQNCLDHPDLWHPMRAFPHVFNTLKPALRQQFDLHAEHAGSSDTVGISNSFGFGALVAQDKFNLPTITLHLQPGVLWSDHQPPLLAGLGGPRWWRRLGFRIGERFYVDPVVCPFVNAWRKELGLPPVKKIVRWWHSKFGVLCMFPEWFAAPQPDWPQPLLMADFPMWNDRTSDTLSPAVQAFLDAGDAPLAFTPGSANLHGRKFFEASVEACRLLNRRGILLSKYSEQIPGNLPASVLHVKYEPLDLLLPKCRAFIHHGGIGSTSQALASGIPHLVMPLAHDQFDNAERLQKLGVGDSLAEKKFTAPRLVKKLKTLLDSQAVDAKCREIASQKVRQDGLQRAATMIEEHCGKNV